MALLDIAFDMLPSEFSHTSPIAPLILNVSVQICVATQGTVYNCNCVAAVLNIDVYVSVHVSAHSLVLQFDISDVTREGVGVCCQLMVGQSSVPHYQQLEEFSARLAPGEVSLFVGLFI